MKSLRIGRRLLLIVTWTLLLLPVVAAGYVVAAWRPALRVAWRAFIVHTWSKGILWILGANLVRSGDPPSPPFILVANHTSYLDVLVLASHVRAAFVSRGDVSSWPVIGFLARIGGTLFIDRRNKRDVVRINRLMASIVEHGGGIAFFPEGTTSRGDDVHRFRPSLLEFPATRKLPVSYATIHYRTPAGSPPAYEAICWWGDAGFVDHLLNVLALPEFEARLAFGADTVRHDSRKVLAHELEERVRSQFEPMAPVTPVDIHQSSSAQTS